MVEPTKLYTSIGSPKFRVKFHRQKCPVSATAKLLSTQREILAVYIFYILYTKYCYFHASDEFSIQVLMHKYL